MATTVYATRIILTDTIGIITIPDGDLISAKLTISGNINFAQGNTLDNSSSGFVAGNRTAMLDFSAFIRQGSAFQEYLLQQAQQTTSNLSVAGLIATAGLGYQVNPVTRFTLNNCAFSDEDYNMNDVSSPMVQNFTLKALTYVIE